MSFQELIILLPCHSLEDFPTYHEGDDADSLLASWSSLWHPALLASARKMPTWARADTPPHDTSGRLLVIPTVSVSQLQTGFAQRAKESGATVVRRALSRPEILETALHPIGSLAREIDADLAADFMALGTCYLQIQLLTRQMRYSSSLDEIHFLAQLVDAATFAVEGNVESAREKLVQCFQLLAQERDRYYPVSAFLIDWTLVGPTTLGNRLSRELAGDRPGNLQLSQAILQAIVDGHPNLHQVIRQRFQAGDIGITFSEADELKLSLMSLESVREELGYAADRFEQLLSRRPLIYGRRRFGMTPQLPQILHKFGVQGVLHATLDAGKFPQGTQSKTRWAGLDGTVIDMLGQVPLDANQSATFLSFASKLGASMDSDHVATLCLAHWPDHVSVWYEDLRRIARQTHALGKFVTVERYFADTDAPGQTDRFEASQYRSPYLQQSVIRKQLDPISTSIRYWKNRTTLSAANTMRTLASLATGATLAVAAELTRRVDALSEVDEHAVSEAVEQELRQSVRNLLRAFPAKSSNDRTGTMVFNPTSRVRRTGIAIPGNAAPPNIEKPVYTSSQAGDRQYAVVDVPAFGYAWVEPGTAGTASSRTGKKRDPVIAEDNILRNEFFEALINPTTGTLQAFREYGARRNRISQQLAFRQPSSQSSGDDDLSHYSVMAADSCDIVYSDSTFGELKTTGRLLDREGKGLARFEQRYQLWRGSRILLADITLEPKAEPQADPWNSYYACRFAWGDELADLFHTVHESRQPVGSKQFESPLYVDIVNEERRTTILTGGLPYHRRIGHTMLDSLLITRGEQERRFRIGIGLDLGHPHHDAIAMLAPETVIADVPGPLQSSQHGWLLHLDNRNIMATHIEPIEEGGRIVGVRLRLLECTGAAGRVTLSAFRPLQRARQVNFRGEELAECGLENGVVRVELSGHEWVEVEARW